jgi:hypothetical protein
MNRRINRVACAAAFLFASAPLYAECFGDGAYRVCTDTYTDSRGNTTIRSYDTQGNTYSVNTESYRTPGGNTVRSSDSMGNSYEVKTWTDSKGTHSVDSMGNRCTITKTGKMIGCGQ